MYDICLSGFSFLALVRAAGILIRLFDKREIAFRARLDFNFFEQRVDGHVTIMYANFGSISRNK